MALWWNSKVRELSTALADIGELKSTLADTLTSNGFSDVRHTADEVAGGKN